MRNSKIDIAKAIGIIFVIFGHVGFISHFVYLFHMALFFFISGYLYNDARSQYPLKYIKTKLEHLWFPFVLCSSFLIVFHNFFLKIGIYNVSSNFSTVEYKIMLAPLKGSDYIKNIFKVMLFGQYDRIMGGTLWFFKCLFLSSVLFCIVSFILREYFHNKEYIRCIIVVSLFIIGFFSIYINKDFHGYNTALISMGIYYLGFICKKYDIINRVFSSIFNAVALFAISLFVLILIGQFGSINMAGNTYTNLIFFVVCSITGIIFVLSMSEMIHALFKDTKIVINGLAYRGFGILCG